MDRILIQECVGLEADRFDLGTLLRLPLPRNALHRKNPLLACNSVLILSRAERLVAPASVRRLHVNQVHSRWTRLRENRFVAKEKWFQLCFFGSRDETLDKGRKTRRIRYAVSSR